MIESRHRGSMALRRAQKFACRRIPDLDAAPRVAGEELAAIRAEANRVQRRAAGKLDLVTFLLGYDDANVYDEIIVGLELNTFSIRTDRYGATPANASGSGKARDLPPRLCIPDSERIPSTALCQREPLQRGLDRRRC